MRQHHWESDLQGRRDFLVRAICSLGAVGGLGLSSSAHADNWPPAKIIVGNPPGGQTDLFARTIAQGVQRRAGQVVTIDNRPGAGGLIGLQALLSAPPDGSTMLLTTLAALTAPALQKNGLDVSGQIEPVCLLASGGSLVLVNEKVPATDLASFIALAKKQPGKLTYASGGPGSTAHLVGEYLKAQLGIDLVHIPYKGGAPAAMAIRSGEVDVTFIDEANASPLLKEGKVRAIAQTGLVALPSFPGLTRVADIAPGFDASFWMGLTVRKGTPIAAVERWHQLASEIVRTDLQEPIVRAGLAPGGGSRISFGQFMAAENEKWLRIIHSNRITSN